MFSTMFLFSGRFVQFMLLFSFLLSDSTQFIISFYTKEVLEISFYGWNEGDFDVTVYLYLRLGL